MKITFPLNTLQIDTHSRPMYTSYTNAAISNDTGSLLFYSNGVYIANALDDTLLNGSGLNPSFYTTSFYQDGLRLPQANLIIPKPENDSLYFLFHETEDIPSPLYKPNKLYYSVINMNGDSGKGEVIAKNQILINDTLFVGGLTVCKHANGRDWWLLVPEYGSSIGFYLMLITPNSIQTINHYNFGFDGTGIGQSCFSPDGTKFLFSYWYGAAFFDFDRCNGTLSLIDTLSKGSAIYCVGASVSSNSRYAYIGSDGYYILQFDLQSTNIISSIDTVAFWDGFESPIGIPALFWLHQIGPDGKIYISTGNSTFVYHKIDSPDSAGLGSNIQQHSISFVHLNYSIPNFPNYNLGPLLGSVCDSLGLGVAENSANSFNIRVNPNPCSNNFYLNYDIATNKNLLFVLYDGFGKEVLRKNLYGTTKYLLISTQGLSDGVYYGVVSSDTSHGFKRETVKVVVIRY